MSSVRYSVQTPESIRIALELLKLNGESRKVRGVKIIRLIFRAFEGMGDIDQRLVFGPDGDGTYLGLTFLLAQMGLRIDSNHMMDGQLTNYVDKPSLASQACEGFTVWLKARADNIFIWKF